MLKKVTPRQKNIKIDKIIGNNLRSLRVQAGFTQAQLGEPLGVSFQQIQKYELGANRVSASTMFLLCTILKCQFSDFFEGLDTQGKLQDSHKRYSKDQLEVLRIYSNLPTKKMQDSFRSVLKTFASTYKVETTY